MTIHLSLSVPVTEDQVINPWNPRPEGIITSNLQRVRQKDHQRIS